MITIIVISFIDIIKVIAFILNYNLDVNILIVMRIEFTYYSGLNQTLICNFLPK